MANQNTPQSTGTPTVSSRNPAGSAVGVADRSDQIDAINVYRQRAMDAGLGKERIDDIFTNNDNYPDALKQLVKETRQHVKESREEYRDQLNSLKEIKNEIGEKPSYDDLSDTAKKFVDKKIAKNADENGDENADEISNLVKKLAEDRQHLKELEKEDKKRKEEIAKLESRVKEREERLKQLANPDDVIAEIDDKLDEMKKRIHDLEQKVEDTKDPFEGLDPIDDDLFDTDDPQQDNPFASANDLVKDWHRFEDFDEIRDQLDPGNRYEAAMLCLAEKLEDEGEWKLKYDPSTRQLTAKKNDGDLWEIYRPNQFFVQGKANNATFDRFAQMAASIGWKAAEPVNMEERVPDDKNGNLENLKNHFGKKDGVRTEKRPANAPELFQLDPATLPHIDHFDDVYGGKHENLPDRLKGRVKKAKNKPNFADMEKGGRQEKQKNTPETSGNDDTDSDSDTNDDNPDADAGSAGSGHDDGPDDGGPANRGDDDNAGPEKKSENPPADNDDQSPERKKSDDAKTDFNPGGDGQSNGPSEEEIRTTLFDVLDKAKEVGENKKTMVMYDGPPSEPPVTDQKQQRLRKAFVEKQFKVTTVDVANPGREEDKELSTGEELKNFVNKLG